MLKIVIGITGLSRNLGNGMLSYAGTLLTTPLTKQTQTTLLHSLTLKPFNLYADCLFRLTCFIPDLPIGPRPGLRPGLPMVLGFVAAPAANFGLV